MSVLSAGRLVAGRVLGLSSVMTRSGPTFKTSNLKNLRGARNRLRNVPRRFVMPTNTNERPESVTVLETPTKSDSDKKSYRVIRLQNGLTALLISDPRAPVEDGADNSDEESDESDSETSDSDSSDSDGDGDGDGKNNSNHFENKAAACALCIGAGSFSDPPNIQGMAHFVEHMVFMGSRKYPIENDFDAFIRKKGGFDNAQTDCETTTFFFEIQENHLAEAMDRFAQFFVAPLMKQEAMQREREAIESEFALATPLDGNRKDQLLCATLPEGHPGRTFMWGNHRSLTPPIGPSDVDLYKAAHEFQKRHYSAHRMTVAVQARFPLDTLEKYVIATFGQIPTNKLPADDFTAYEFTPSIVTREFNALYYVKPMMQTSNLTLTWCMRSFIKDYKTKPHQYVSWIIGHEGTGSLLLYLQRKVWALGLSSGISEGGIEHTSVMSLFSLSIVLTQEGLLNIDKVLDAVFSYINMLKRDCPCERIFDEIKRIEEINFRFKDEPQPYDNVEQLCENMQYLPPEHYMTGQDLMFEYDPDAIMYVINGMSPNTVNLMLQSQNYPEPIQYDQVEEWFGTEYKKVELLKRTLDRWKNMVPEKEFHLPEVNRFIPNNFDLIPPPPEANKKDKDVKSEDGSTEDKDITKSTDTESESTSDPNVSTEIATSQEGAQMSQKDDTLKLPEIKVNLKLIRSDELMEVWFKPDYRFDLPYTFVYLYFITPLATESAKTACMMDLWCAALTQLLTEKLYAADVTGLSRSLFTEEKGIMLKLNGFSQTLPTVVDEITQMLSNYSDGLTLNLFDAIKDIHAKSYYNVVMKPNKLVKEVRLSMLMVSYRSILDKLRALRTVTYEDLKGFGERFKEKLYIKMLMQGNLLKDDALKIADTIQKNMNWKPMNNNEKPRILIHEMPLGEKHCRISSFNPADVNSVVTNYYQYGVSDIKNCCIVEMIILLMEEPLFNTLRTQEQLGYNVFCMMRYTNGILGFSITVNVQAEKYTTGYVDTRIEAFMEEFFKTMQDMSTESFEQSKTALIKLKSGVDVELKDEVRRHWGEISSSEYQYNKLQLEIDCLKSLTLKDITAWWQDYAVKSDEKFRRKLSVQIVGHKPVVRSELTEHVNKKVKICEQHDYTIQYMDIDEYPNDCIKDIAEFKKSLGMFPEKDGSLAFDQLRS